MLKSQLAVSESIGFIMIVFILLTSFVIIYLLGYPIYNSYVDSGHMQNVQKSFSIIASNGNIVALEKSPVSSSELKMYGGTLQTRDTGYMNILYYDGAGNLIDSRNSSMNALEYTRGTSKVAYVDGSICTSDLNGAVMIEDPEITGNNGLVLIPIIDLYQSDVAIAGETLTRITLMTPYASKMSQVIMSPGPEVVHNVGKIKVTIEGDYASCFSDYFQRKLGFSPAAGTNGELNVTRTYNPTINLALSTSYLTISAA